MILVLGASGYIGQSFATELTRRRIEYKGISRSDHDYSDYKVLVRILRDLHPQFLVNCAGFTGKPNVDACESARADTLHGNTLLPLTIAHACESAGVPWGHVSSGCIFAGAKVQDASGEWHVEKDLMRPGVIEIVQRERERVLGFDESDPPNFSFRDPPCSFYSGTKALAEESLLSAQSAFVWRLRIPFDEIDSSRNYLSKLQRYPRAYDNFNSISHRGDFARACLDLWSIGAPYGTYNVVNPGFVSTREVISMIGRILLPDREFEFWKDDAEFYASAGRVPRSNCILNSQKLSNAGVSIRSVQDALTCALQNWKKDLE